MPRIISPDSWKSRATLSHARSLLGKVLVRRGIGGVTSHLITEVEAYIGEKDLACHASRGLTRRTRVLFGPAGNWYVYLVYGMHEMLNLVTGPDGWPSAILIRGLNDVTGPGRLTRALGIDRALNGRPAVPGSGLHIEDHGIRVPHRLVKRTPRIGIDYAGPVWAAKPWRFVIGTEALASFSGELEKAGPKTRAGLHD